MLRKMVHNNKTFWKCKSQADGNLEYQHHINAASKVLNIPKKKKKKKKDYYWTKNADERYFGWGNAQAIPKCSGRRNLCPWYGMPLKSHSENETQ